MALRSTSIPKWINDAVQNVIATHSQVFAAATQIPVDHGELRAEKIRATVSVYTAGVPKRRDDRRSAIAHHKLWLKPKHVAWRFLLETNRGVTVGVEIHANRKKRTFHQLQYGPLIQRTFDALQRAGRSSRTKKKDFLPAILQIPALYFSALWLTASRGPDLYIPLVSYPGRIKIGRFYARKEIVAALVDNWINRREAHKKLKLTRKQRGANERRS